MHDKTVIVFAGGEMAPLKRPLPEFDLVIAADSGLDHATAAGVAVDLLVGDLDSVSDDALTAAREAGVGIEEHPPDKDATDLELALAAAVRHGAAHIVVLGGGGGRIDHLLANAMLLASPAWSEIDVEWHVDSAHILAIRSEATLTGRAGDLLTLLAIGEPADGVTTEGLAYELTDEVLLASSTRGVSNTFTGTAARVRVRTGILLAIHVLGD
ncbi:MAG: thiamine diphosphokinase [Acidimicrobiia bacterium]|nr:thiamine diphosphokinase [Acidimicrobiia bacterium]MBT8218042.1 thiamine diphosphokinase [Acidimicrobiia bacterium]NNF09364.1 thiamine diphosphokinase [Acidimicrobiia bacterium]NNL71197.1 thiamine diphosphokinase [Acidimicrobiia bacterium]